MDPGTHERGREVRTRVLSAGGSGARRCGPALIAALAVLGLPAAAGAAPVPTGRLLVTLKPAGGVAHAAATARGVVGSTGARLAGPVRPRLRLVTVRPAVGQGLHAAAVALRRLSSVASVETEHRYTLRAVPNDPALTTPELAPGTPPGTTVQWWAARENLAAMWDIPGTAGATVAVIDTGLDSTHPELASKISGVADHDDTPGHGGPGVDETGHGTHVASLACAASGDGVALAGAGLDCRLFVVKSDLSDSSVAASIMDAVDHGADAINMSFGTDGALPAATPIVRAVDYAVSKGVVLVAAAADKPVQEQGDPSNLLQPTGSGPDITQGRGLSVTAANFADQRAPFAGLGTQISMAAYGAFAGSTGPAGIFGAFPRNATDLERPTLTTSGCDCRTTFNGDNRYAYIQGTSMAAPMVAAVAAVVRHLNPDLSAAEITQLLKQTASRAVGTGWTPDLGWGILNGGAAAQAARVIDRRAPTSSVRGSERVVRGSTVTLRFKSADRAPANCVASGVKKIELWRAANGARPRRLRTTTASSLHLRVRRGSRYSFYTRAVDAAGNREPPPSRSDTTVRGV